MDSYLRKVIHPQAHDNFRVIWKDDGTEIEIGSIGIQHGSGATEYWAWAIDTVMPMRAHQTQGCGTERADKFKEAWTRFAADEAPPTKSLPNAWSN
jgi:hypothetical protein